MAETVYSPTTVSNPKSKWFLVPHKVLDCPRFIVKSVEVILSLVAFVQEETVKTCISCSVLYFFEFVSCTAFLFTLLLLLLLSTPLHQKVGVPCWREVDMCYTAAILVLFFISSIIFSVDNKGTDLEKGAAAFGFLASFAFLLDLVLYIWDQGLPFRLSPPLENSTNGPCSPSGPPEVPESERLTENKD